MVKVRLTETVRSEQRLEGGEGNSQVVSGANWSQQRRYLECPAETVIAGTES